jgi:betaine lipid synthase
LVPVLTQTDIEHDNHYYYLVLNGRFSKDNCPDYLQEGPFKGLQENVHKIRNYNDSFVNVLGSHIYDKVILMDHLDWTDHDYVQTLCDTLRYHMRYSVESKALLRSAARVPWYIEVFRRNGFVATRVAARQPDRCMDRVNTYASCWVIRHSVVSKN